MSEYEEYVCRFYPDSWGEKSITLFGVPIVRCRDCVKWHHIDTLDGVRYGECDEWKRADSYCVPATRESGFCAWATCKCGEDIETNGRESVTCPSCGRMITE